MGSCYRTLKGIFHLKITQLLVYPCAAAKNMIQIDHIFVNWHIEYFVIYQAKSVPYI